MTVSTRRQLLAATATLALAHHALARTVSGTLPWTPNEVYPPEAAARPGPWQFFTADEAVVVEAIADRLIPTDELGPGAKDAGCAVFIDRQLVSAYGGYDWLYMEGPFKADAAANFGIQSPLVPREQYRRGLAALAAYTKAHFDNKLFHQLSPDEQDKLLTAMEKNAVQFDGYHAQSLFTLIHTNVIEGYFADPIYGGNRDMAGWKLVGFPGTRYDYRDVIANPNKPYTMPPVGLRGRPDWQGGRAS